MRILVACPSCHRQWDVTGKPTGARLRCACGASLVVPQPVGHEAAVVRCSACGAPCLAGATSCQFCGARFTLRDQDLDTLCPSCLTAISHDERFCHHCGTRIEPRPYAEAPSPLVCPACGGGAALSERRVSDPAVVLLECQRCGGLWVSAEVFEALVKRSRGAAAPLAGPLAPAGPAQNPAQNHWHEQQGALYRPCPVCGRLMNRRNYGQHSGVIIDACAEHGAWFDRDELAEILEWIRTGGENRAASLDADERHAAASAARLQTLLQTPALPEDPQTVWPAALGSWGVLIEAMRALFRR